MGSGDRKWGRRPIAPWLTCGSRFERTGTAAGRAWRAPRATLPGPVRRAAPAPPISLSEIAPRAILVGPARKASKAAGALDGAESPLLRRRRSLKTQQHVRSGVPTGGFEIVSRFEPIALSRALGA